jgi:AcrR family transcriptional regulator
MSREKIIDAAINVFSQSGYHKASMDDIARVAEVAKGTLYYHFSSKSELFKVLVTEGINMITEKIKKQLNDDTMDQQLRKVIESNVSLYLQYSELARIFFNEISNGIDAEVLDEIEALKRKYVIFIADLLRAGYSQGYFHTINYELAAAGIIGLLNGTCKYYLNNMHDLTPAEITDFMIGMISSGLVKK